ncbi:hypothetical protein RCL1_008519 [Eukaryota sp. TZLM3-RCL]
MSFSKCLDHAAGSNNDCIAGLAFIVTLVVGIVLLTTTHQESQSYFLATDFPGLTGTVEIWLDKAKNRIRLDYDQNAYTSVRMHVTGDSVWTIVNSSCSKSDNKNFFYFDNLHGWFTHKREGKKVMKSGVKCKHFVLKKRPEASICLRRWWFHHRVYEICDTINGVQSSCVQFSGHKSLGEDPYDLKLPLTCPR